MKCIVIIPLTEEKTGINIKYLIHSNIDFKLQIFRLKPKH